MVEYLDPDLETLEVLEVPVVYLALLELLARRSRILKPKFAVIAVHVGMTNIPYQSDLEYLKGYSEDLGVPFVHYETFFDPSTDTRKYPCSFATVNKAFLRFQEQRKQGDFRVSVLGSKKVS
jgi:hypothetical protein